MSLSLKPEHLKRYKDFAVLLYKYGRNDLVKTSGLSELLPDDPQTRAQAAPEAAQLADDVEAMGPTFIKLGQLLSTRPDIIPPVYADALRRLQDHVKPFDFEDVERIVTDELGVRLSKAFQRFERVPLAAASIAQVHYAVTHDGREVAVKVQRPGIREQVLSDLEALAEVARFLEDHSELGHRYGVVSLFDEFRKSMVRELDFRQEAMHLVTIAENLKDIEEIVIPAPVMSYTTARVLTMEFVPGVKVTSLSPLAKLEINGEKLIDALFRAYLKQILQDGVFHADPHPGNVFLVDGRIALIDLGMVARVSPSTQDRLLQLLLAVSENRADDAAKTLILIGHCLEGADQRGFERGVVDLIAQHQEVTIAQPQVGRTVLMLMKVAAEHAIQLPPELAMIGKTLLNLDEIGRTLAPTFDPNAAIRRHAGEITRQHMTQDLSLGSLLSTAIDVKNFVQQLPGRINRLLDRLSENEFRVRVDAIDETRLMEGMQKVANRIATGLVLAALIVGAALLMDIPTSFELFGYPGIAILLFLGAALGGVLLLVSIFMTDIKARRH